MLFRSGSKIYLDWAFVAKANIKYDGLMRLLGVEIGTLEGREVLVQFLMRVIRNYVCLRQHDGLHEWQVKVSMGGKRWDRVVGSNERLAEGVVSCESLPELLCIRRDMIQTRSKEREIMAERREGVRLSEDCRGCAFGDFLFEAMQPESLISLSSYIGEYLRNVDRKGNWFGAVWAYWMRTSGDGVKVQVKYLNRYPREIEWLGLVSRRGGSRWTERLPPGVWPVKGALPREVGLANTWLVNVLKRCRHYQVANVVGCCAEKLEAEDLRRLFWLGLPWEKVIEEPRMKQMWLETFRGGLHPWGVEWCGVLEWDEAVTVLGGEEAVRRVMPHWKWPAERLAELVESGGVGDWTLLSERVPVEVVWRFPQWRWDLGGLVRNKGLCWAMVKEHYMMGWGVEHLGLIKDVPWEFLMRLPLAAKKRLPGGVLSERMDLTMEVWRELPIMWDYERMVEAGAPGMDWNDEELQRVCGTHGVLVKWVRRYLHEPLSWKQFDGLHFELEPEVRHFMRPSGIMRVRKPLPLANMSGVIGLLAKRKLPMD